MLECQVSSQILAMLGILALELSLLFPYCHQGCSVFKMCLTPILFIITQNTLFLFNSNFWNIWSLCFHGFETDCLYSIRRAYCGETWFRLRIVFVCNSILWKSYILAYISNVHHKVVLKFRLLNIETYITIFNGSVRM